MDEDERSKLREKLNKDVEEYISQLPRKKYEDGWPENRWEEEMEKHPIFRSKPIEDGEELPPLIEAMQQLKYDPDVNSPDELATSYKEDGNQNFKRKKYRWATDAYTKGLEANSENIELNAQLYTNRAAAQYHIGNFKKALDDAIKAKNLKPSHLKALQRGAMCCFELRMYEDCLSWCDDGLKLDEKDQCLLELKRKAQEKKTAEERDKRKAAKLQLKKKMEAEQIKNAIMERHICLAEGAKFDFTNLKSLHPDSDSIVHLVDGKLVWPVMFFYPEYNLTECIEKFHEDSCIYTEFEEMHKMLGHPEWGKDKKYLPQNLQVYFSDGDDVIPFDKMKPLKTALSHERYKVYHATPSFFITAANSEFDRVYRRRHNLPT